MPNLYFAVIDMSGHDDWEVKVFRSADERDDWLEKAREYNWSAKAVEPEKVVDYL